MSMSKTICDTIESAIKTYIKKIASNYNINENDLYNIWNDKCSFEQTSTDSRKDVSLVAGDPVLSKLNKKELIEICKVKNLIVSGTKNDLIKRITDSESSKNKSMESFLPKGENNIIKNLTSKIQSIQIKRNNFGNFEHAETKFLFNNTTKKVYGKQNDDGTVSELTTDDINICHKYKFAYDIPENLDKKTSLNDVDEEDDDDDDDDDGEEEFIEVDEDELVKDEMVIDDDLDDDDLEEDFEDIDDEVELEDECEEY